MNLPIFIDIDGTLTMSGDASCGEPCVDRIQRVRELIKSGKEVVIWSGRGTAYAKVFSDKHDLKVLAAVGKPIIMVDDNLNLRPEQRLKMILPKDFFGA